MKAFFIIQSSLFVLLGFGLIACSGTSEKSTKVDTPQCAKFDFSCGFSAYDKNGSGHVNRVEFEDHVSKYFDSLDTDQSGHIRGHETSTSQGWHTRVPDPNGDASITIIEFVGTADALFDQADKNRDRQLDAQEFQENIRPHEFTITGQPLPRVCVGDFHGKVTHWELFEKQIKSQKLAEVYATRVPPGQRWTCVPVEGLKHKYAQKIHAFDETGPSSCEVNVQAGNWIEARKNKEGRLICEVFPAKAQKKSKK